MKDKHLPVLGIGPFYVISCLLLMLFGLFLKARGLLHTGDISEYKTALTILGLLLIISGIALWLSAVLFQRMDKKIKAGQLVTTGAYALVRNPIYSAFLFLFSGILLLAHNKWLLILPLIYWGLLTILLKLTEEKWLIATFGEDYLRYTTSVNRIIPWFTKKKSA